MLNKTKKFIVSFLAYIQYGIRAAYSLSLLSINSSRKNETDLITYYHKIIKRYLDELLRYIQIQPQCTAEKNNTGPVWVCWWQGEDNMPAIVRACWNNLKKNVQNRPVILITKDNYSKYAEVPDIILKQLILKNITITHFSDILRACLLYQNGGFWFDATIYLSQPIDDILDNSANFFTIRSPYTEKYVSKGQWCGFLMGGGKGHPLFKFMIDSFVVYWKHNKNLIDYFLIDYIIAVAYDRYSIVQKDINTKAYQVDKLYDIQRLLTQDFSIEYFKILKQTPIHKLSWKLSECNVKRGSLKEWIEKNNTL